MNHDLVVTIQIPVYGGDFMAICEDGTRVFIPYVLPQEKVRIRLTESRSHYKRGVALEILTASHDRILPRCKHFCSCGGCHYQHIAYEAQLQMKTAVLREQLQRLGRITDPPISMIFPSSRHWNYRNVMQFHIGECGKPGLQAASSHDLIEITECHLPELAISRCWPGLTFPPEYYGRRVEIRTDFAENPIILQSDGRTLFAGDDERHHCIREDQPLSSHLAGNDTGLVIYQIKKQVFKVKAGAFFQVNLDQAEAMVEYVMTVLKERSISIAFDVYCGVGLFTKFLAPLVDHLVAIELSIPACESFRYNTSDLTNVSLYQGRAEDVLPTLPDKPELLLVDPPRSGLSKSVIQAILAISPEMIIYVSCDPATLARDISFLIQDQYRLMEIKPFDLFPQTYHIESISTLIKINA